MVAIAREQGVLQTGHWNFWLEKKIPAGAGLGGGSSNAAGVINLLKNFYKLELTLSELVGLAAALGADVPFFLQPGLALVEGVGDHVTRLPRARKRYYLLIKPPVSIATGWAYSALHAPEEKIPVDYDIKQFQGDLPQSEYILENDFEAPVMAAYPQIAEIKDWLSRSSGVLGALMSGSGSVVYAIYAELGAAVQAETAARKRWSGSGCEFFLARNLDRF
jgi:4-diphosphocytidyl-2-C-methyl-D-erythritol kinase